VANLSAQKNVKWSADLSMGIPVTFFSINSDLTGIYQAGLRYSINKNWSVSGRFASKSFFAKTSNTPGVVSPDGIYAKDVLSYRNSFYDINGYVQYNLGGLLGLNKPTTKFSPYATLGAGLQFWKLNTTYINGVQTSMKEFGDKPMRNYQFGLGLRYYLNPSIDLVVSSEFNYVETYWMDGAFADKKLDTYLNNSFGISYKIGAKSNKNLIDWEFRNTESEDSPKKDYARWSADLNLGLPIMFTPIGYSPTVMGGLAARYSFSNFFSLQGAYHYGQFSGSHDVVNPPSGTVLDASYIKDFSNSMNQLTVRGLFNLRRLKSEPESLNKWNYYAVVGGGYLFYSVNNNFANNTKNEIVYNEGTQNIVVGAQARKHLTSTWDFLAGVDFNYNQSKWLDGAANKDNLNHHLYINAGISYKFSTSNNRELIDWSSSNYKYTKASKDVDIEKIPVIEKPAIVDVPKVVEQAPIDTVKAIIETPIPVVQPEVVIPVEVPVTKVEPKVIAPIEPIILENKEAVTEPDGKYNVVVACYGLKHLDLAMKFRDTIRKKGFKSNVYRSIGSKYYRVMTTSTDDKGSALQILKKSKAQIDSESWFYLYNKQ
jgi:hypothetical protein